MTQQTVEKRVGAGAQIPRAGGAGSRKNRQKQSSPVWHVMLAPSLILIISLLVYPLIRAVIMTFQKTTLAGKSSWVGFDNYTRLATDEAFWRSMGVTAVFSVGAVVLELALAWALALFLWNGFKRLNTFFRIVFAIPMMLSPVIVGVVWRTLLNPQFGWINAVLGTDNADWLGNPQTALPVLILVDVWQWTPFLFLIVASGLAGVPEEVIEAAKIDGAGYWRVLRSIVIPLTAPVTIIGALFRFVDATKTFDLPYNLTSGGPGTATETVGMFIYRKAFTYYEQGYASALSLVLTIIVGGLAFFILRWLGRVQRELS